MLISKVVDSGGRKAQSSPLLSRCSAAATNHAMKREAAPNTLKFGLRVCSIFSEGFHFLNDGQGISPGSERVGPIVVLDVGIIACPSFLFPLFPPLRVCCALSARQ